ncbi:MAG: AbrB/MazE/SpoVT family DNA-binding domain-containing protein [Patescibacteria group bacterium]
MQYIVSVTQKGQATIPVQIRNKFGMGANTRVIFEITNDNEVMLKPTVDFFKFRGSIKAKKPFDIGAMEKAIQNEIVTGYAKKST